MAILASLALATTACSSDRDDPALAQASSIRYGVDYSWSRPSLGELAADGYSFVARYLSYDTSGKNISADEANALVGNGFDIVLVWEQTATAPLQGYARGVSDAQAAASQAASVGAPATIPIYFAVDFDAQASQQPAIDAYFDGVAAVLGRDRTGAYGGYYLINRLFNGGKIAYGWQTYAWSYGAWDSRAQVRQIDNGILGGQADEDMAIADDFGQWGRVVVEEGPEPGAPALPTSCGGIEPGHGLAAGQGWRSCDSRFTLSMQLDGNLVLYSGGVALWASHTNTGAIAVMQDDGNFVVYSHHSHPVFATGTFGNPGARLALQDDGNVVVYSGGAALWSTGTAGFPPGPTACGVLAPNQALAIGQVLTSCDGRYALAQQGDGNLVLYHGGSALWSTQTYGSDARFSIMQGDGNLVLYGPANAVWASGTDGAYGASLVLQDDGNLVIYAGGVAVWASGTAGQ